MEKTEVLVPRYSEGEILVRYRDVDSKGVCLDAARVMGRIIGYELTGEEYRHAEDVFIYRTEVGREEEAIRAFRDNQYRKFVDWAERRDLNLESRFDSFEEAARMLEEWSDYASGSEKDFEERRQAFMDALENIV